ncbi:serine hydrolase domain-containing protein [Microbacterium hydrocarbonoxydans]|uniref:serine hydrolase domain-containing protein n=1 Tax=Microbacterium hydrocarbonoxydans TaxID=273678 RepID=UPI00203A4781|nr:serine hydrolase [Microbacterium hydrocarbonoxydans]MCM3779132.1 serine hydrolase [Microbacterium hydrocarbonoxydans]
MTRAASLRDRLVDEVEASGFGAHGLHVRVGDSAAEHRWTVDEREEIHSVAKGVSALAVGMADAEGVLSLDEPISRLAGDATLGRDVDGVTLRRLLSMSSGIDLPWTPTMMTDWPDLAAEFLSRDSRGRTFQYSNASTYTAMRLLERAVGDVEDYIRPRLFAPLGLDDVEWRRCPLGFVLAGEGLALRTEEMSRIGRLLRDRGVWNGERIVPGAVVDAMHSDWVSAGTNEGYERYGLGAWDGPGPAWRLHGAYGQLVILHGDTVVTVSADDHFRADAFAAAAVRLIAG